MMFSWWPSPIKVFSGNQLLSRFSTRLCHWVLVLFWELPGRWNATWNLKHGFRDQQQQHQQKKKTKWTACFHFHRGTQTGSSLSLSYDVETNSANSTTSWPVITAVGAAASGAAGWLLFLGVFWHIRIKTKTFFLSFRRGGRFIHRMEAHRQKTSSVWNCRMWWEFELMVAAAGNGYISILLDYSSIYAF